MSNYYAIDCKSIKNAIELNISGQATLKVILKTGFISSYRAGGASETSLMDTLSANTVHINLYGASKMNGSLSVQSLINDLNDASSIDINGTVNFEINTSGASNLFYKGDAFITSQSLTGASTVVKVD